MHILNRKKVYCLALLIQKKFRVLAKKPHKYMNPKAFEDGVRVSIYIYIYIYIKLRMNWMAKKPHKYLQLSKAR